MITQCPHCFNTLANEYPQFGGNYQVVHHSQLLMGLVKEGRLKPKNKADGRRSPSTTPATWAGTTTSSPPRARC